MIGKPKFKKEEKVSFIFNGKNYIGKIFIVDAFGVFEDPSDVHYDILVEQGKESPCLFKHIRETLVTRFD